VSLRRAFSERRPFPGQDPWVVAHDGSFLLVQSAGGNTCIVVRRFDDLARMHRNVATVIWAPGRRRTAQRELWAPELHHIEGRWYLYYAAGDGRRGSHRMYALGADDPLGPYEDLGPVGDAGHDAWAIDLTVFAHEGRLYGLWSGWERPDDGFPQNLYVAAMSDPWTISGERRCLSRPEHDWEVSVAPVNEGPEVVRNPLTGALFIVYAADASWTQAYKTGLLEWTGGDVADPASWRKLPHPLFTGGGHGCMVDTPAGPHLVYHRKMTADPGWSDREICTAPVAWGVAGHPVVVPAGAAGDHWAVAARPEAVGMGAGDFREVQEQVA
jgi:GH43 family beta-xylosidase